MNKKHLLWLTPLALTCAIVMTLEAQTFTPLAGSGGGGAYQPGDLWGYQTAEKVRQNFNNLNTRVTAVEGGTGVGDVDGAASSTDNAITRFDGTTGKTIQNSGITIADGASGTLAGSNSGDVTLGGSPNYLTLAGQVLTRALIDLTAHVTGRLPFANFVQASAASKLVGRGSASGAGDLQEIAIGSGLSMSGTTLSATGGAGGVGDVVGPASSVASEIVLFDLTTGKLIKRATGTGVVHATSGVYSAGNVDLASEITGNLPSANLGTTGTPQFARVGIGAAADSTAALKVAGQIYTPEVSHGSMGSTETIDWDGGNQHRGALDANVTFTFSNPKEGGRYLLILTQDGTGSRTVTWPAAVKWPAGTAPTLTTTASATDLCTFAYTGAASGIYTGSCVLDIR